MFGFSDKIDSFFSDFGTGRKMVLSTSESSKVSSRMMSVVQLDGEFYFQTDITMRKYRQLCANNTVALCIDNIQVEGTCMEVGHPLHHARFCEAYQACFKNSYDAYSSLKNERLFVVKPLYIQRWVYKDSMPYIESFDVKNQQHQVKQYLGI